MAATILIVDDDKVLQKQVARGLEREGFQVIAVSTGLAGLGATQTEPKPDLILLDVDMPDMDGLQVAATLHTDSNATGIPIIFLSGYVSQKDKMAGFEAGGVGFLTKPLAMPELIARIRREADARGIAIASLEGTFNMSHPDAEHRRTGLRRLRVLAEVCPAPIRLWSGLSWLARLVW